MNKLDQLLNNEWADLNQVVYESVIKHRDWYARKCKAPMYLFRAMSVVVIALGAAISYFAFLQKQTEKTQYSEWIFLLSLGSSLLTSYLTFFQLQATWESRRMVELQLTGLLTRLRMEWILAADIGDALKARSAAHRAAGRCIDAAAVLISTETAAFFSGMTSKAGGAPANATKED